MFLHLWHGKRREGQAGGRGRQSRWDSMRYSENIRSHQCAGITAIRIVKFLGLVLRYNSWLKSTLQHRQIFTMVGMKLMAELGREELNTGPLPGKYLLTSTWKLLGFVHWAAKGKSSCMFQHAWSLLHTQIFTWGIAGAAGWIHVWVVGWGSGGIARRITCNEKKREIMLLSTGREKRTASLGSNKQPVWAKRPAAQLRGKAQMYSQLARVQEGLWMHSTDLHVTSSVFHLYSSRKQGW